MSLMNKEAGRKCMLDVGGILDYAGIPFFLFQGTALGAYRDQGFTPTEQDIDLGVLLEHMPLFKIQRALLLLIDSGFDVEAFTMPFSFPRTLVAFKEYDGHVAKVDIVGLHKWKDKRFTATPIRDWTIEKQYCLVHEAKQVENYSTLSMFGREWAVPHPIEQYLESEYGPDWRTPTDNHVSLLRHYGYLKAEGILP